MPTEICKHALMFGLEGLDSSYRHVHFHMDTYDWVCRSLRGLSLTLVNKRSPTSRELNILVRKGSFVEVNSIDRI